MIIMKGGNGCMPHMGFVLKEEKSVSCEVQTPDNAGESLTDKESLEKLMKSGCGKQINIDLTYTNPSKNLNLHLLDDQVVLSSSSEGMKIFRITRAFD